MNPKLLLPLGILVVVAVVVAASALFTVHQAQQALVLQFGEPKRIVTQPGLYAKLPFIQNVQYYEKRVLDLDPPTERVLLTDQKPLNVDSFARYRITDPLRFFQTVKVEQGLRDRLGSIINSNVRSVLGGVGLASVLSEERAEIMHRIRTRVNEEAERFGINVVDVRIGRTDLPQEVSQAVYARMRTEREQEAAEFRAQGQEQADRIRAAADREATVIRAEARREADILRGEGEAQRTAILNAAFGQDANFFNFYRSMQAYEGSINQDEADNSYIVLSTERNDFFRLLSEGALMLENGEFVPDGATPAPEANLDVTPWRDGEADGSERAATALD